MLVPPARAQSLRWMAAFVGAIATWSAAGAAASAPRSASRRAGATATATGTATGTAGARATARTATGASGSVRAAAPEAAAPRGPAVAPAAAIAAATAPAAAAAAASVAARARATKAPAPAHEEPLVLALGLASPPSDTRLMERFAKAVTAKHYADVYGSWHDHLSTEEIYANEDRMMAKAQTIHFNLSEMNWEKYVAWAKKPDAEREVAHTNHELLQVVKSKDLRAKTVFYLYGKRTDPCEKSHVTGGVGSYAKQMVLMQSVLCGGG